MFPTFWELLFEAYSVAPDGAENTRCNTHK